MIPRFSAFAESVDQIADAMGRLASSSPTAESLVDFADLLSRDHGDAMHALLTGQKPGSGEAAYLAKWSYEEGSPQYRASYLPPSPGRGASEWEYNPDLGEKLGLDFCRDCDRLGDLVRRHGAVVLDQRGVKYALVGGQWWRYKMAGHDGSYTYGGALVAAEKVSSPFVSKDAALAAAVSIAKASGAVPRRMDLSMWR